MGITTFIPFDVESIHHCERLENMLSDYFDETFVNNPQDKVPKRFIPKILKTIGEETSKYKEWLYFCSIDGLFIGFAIFQIDTIDNPLCKREGWGFIREFYIIPSHRRNGYAKQMYQFIEKKLLEDGLRNIYLTSDPNNGIPFWEAMGYFYSGKSDNNNGNKIYVKYLSEFI